jgi:uncharacterized OB-fold protein
MATDAAEAKGYEKPLPPITKLNAPFWEGTKHGELRLQTCSDCGKQWYPPSTHCPECLSRNWEWKAVSGKGKVWSWVRFHQRYFASFEKDLPYNVTFVELDEGVMMMTTLRAIEDGDIHSDMPVKVQFENATDEQSVPYFVPA